MRRLLLCIFMCAILLVSCSRDKSYSYKNSVPSSGDHLTLDVEIADSVPITSAYTASPYGVSVREYVSDNVSIYYPWFDNEEIDTEVLKIIKEYCDTNTFNVKKQFDYSYFTGQGGVSFAFYDSSSAASSVIHKFFITVSADNTKILDVSDFIKNDDPLDYIEKTIDLMYSAEAAFVTGELPDFYVDPHGIYVLDSLGQEFFIPEENFVKHPPRKPVVGANYEPVVNKQEKVVALTFDDGPNYYTTKNLLDVLEKEDVKATFFTVGYNIYGNEYLLRRMIDMGCDVGIHSYAHDNYSSMTYENVISDIERCSALLKSVTGISPHLVRPPFGSLPASYAQMKDYFYINWCVDPYDWQAETSEEIADHIINNVKPGSIVLLHDIYQKSCDAAEIVIKRMKEDGWRFVTVSELFDLKDKTPSGEIYYGL